jgi:hypothetical protein
VSDDVTVLLQARVPRALYDKFRMCADRLGMSDAAMVRFIVGMACDAEAVVAWRKELKKMLHRVRGLTP